MKLLYKLGIRLYYLGILLAGLFGGVKAVKWLDGRRKWRSKLGEFTSNNPIWIHAASLGEFEMAKPLIERIKAKNSKQQVVITFYSPSGYEYSKNYKLADAIFYLPLDTKRNAKDFIAILKPKAAVFVKYDFWFNFLEEIQRAKIPLMFFSANFRTSQYFLKNISKWQKNIVRNIDSILCINADSAAVLEKNGIADADICGDTRFDKVIDNAERAVPVPLIKNFKQDYILLIVGSSWPLEEKIISHYLQEHTPDNLKVIIAPHSIEETRISEVKNEINGPSFTWSEVNDQNIKSAKVLIIDNIGMLANLYQYADIAFVAGGFSNELHNILEPAAMSTALIYGGKISKYPEGKGLANFGGAFTVKNQDDFSQVLNAVVNNKKLIEETKLKSREFVYQNQGASEIVFNELNRLISF